MRNLVSFALACLILLPAAGVRAEGFPVGDEAGPGGVVGEEGPDRGVVAKPTVEIDTTRTGQAGAPDKTFRITFQFSESVNGFTIGNIRIAGAKKTIPLNGTGDSYNLDIETHADLEGDITVTVLAGAATNGTNESNDETTFTFTVDNKVPELEEATADLQTIVLRYHEELDERYQASPNDFAVHVDRADGTERFANKSPAALDVENTEVTLRLFAEDTIHAGDSVKLDYRHTNDILRDEKGNYIPDTTGLKVKNRRQLRKPGPVQNLTATGISTDTIKLDWDIPADIGGSEIIGYFIAVWDEWGSNYQVLRSSTVNEEADTITEHIHDGLQPGETWHYVVSAINGVDEGRSTMTSATTKREGEVPGAPTELTAEPDGNTAIDLDWTAPTNTGTSAISGYRIEVSTDGGNIWTDLVTNTADTNTFYKHTGLQPNTQRHYQVRAINDTDESAPSNVADATTTTTTSAPDPPTGLTATAQGEDQIDLSWTAPSNDGGSPITGYRIEMSDDGTTGWTDLEANTGSAATTYSDNTLTAGTTRHYRVSAINALGTGNPSDVADATTTTTTSAPDPPTGLTATAQGEDQIDLSWTAPSDDGGSPITGYRIERSDDGTTGSWIDLVANTGSTGTTHTDSRLRRGTTRYYRVSAINAVGPGDPSNVDSATTLDVPGSPTGLTATAQGEDQIDLSWTAPSNDGGSPITGYRIEMSDDGTTGSWTDLEANTGLTATTYSDNTLTAGTTRHYRVSAINAMGTGNPSDVDDATTTTTTSAPDPPTGLTATAQGEDQIDLSWTAPSNDGGSPITGYRIEMSDDGTTGSWTDLEADTGSAATTYSDNTLTAGTTRHYRVSAINALGTGNPSNVDDATTEGALPGRPTGLTATAQGTNQIDLAWTAPTDDGGTAITGYRIERSDDGTTGSWIDLVANTGSTGTTHTDSRLRRGTTRYYRVSAINAVGPGDPSNVDSATTLDVPGSPTGLTATAQGEDQIDLSWTAPSNDGGSPITGYRIEMSDDGTTGSWTDLEANTGLTATTYSDNTLTAGTTRHYRVSAINAMGTGNPSDVDDATTTTTTSAPDPPTGLTATAQGEDQIDLSWTAPSNDGGSPITGYRIEMSDDGTTGSWTDLEADTGSAATTYSDNTLTAGTTRHYRVSAINAMGIGNPSNVDDATTEGALPGRPTGLTATAQGTNQIDLAWTAPTDDGGTAITGYRIERSDDGTTGSWIDLVANTGSTGTTHTDSRLRRGTTRYYRVSAINAVGPGDPSNVDSATTLDVPGSPTGLTATAQGEDQIDLSWTAPSNDGGSPITGYRIEMSDDGTTGSWTDLEANTGLTATTYSDNTLTAGTTRHYRVSAINALGTGNPSNVDDATTEGALPGRPTGLTATAQGTNQIDLAWTAPTDDGGTAITGYRIERSDDGTTGSWIDLVANTGSTGTTHTDSRLRRGTTRYYRVSAINAVGDGDPSNVDSATTLDVPGSPTGLTATARDTSQIDLAWTAPTDDGGTAITGYKIDSSENGGATWTVLVENSQSTATTYPDESESLTAGTTRHYRVSAINAIGTGGSASNVAHATTDATVPDAPTNLTATASGRTRIDLDWDPPSFNGGSDITGYRIEISADAGVTWSDLVSNTGRGATSYAHRGLSAGTTRHYRVSAINALGTGNPSNVDDATTEGALPGRPTGLTATAQGTNQIDLAWTAPTDDGGTAITGYRIERSDDGTTGSWIDLVANTGSTGTTHTDSRLRGGTTRYYRVSAINAVGPGDPSNVDSATTLDVPGSPTGLTATARDTSQIDLAWTAPTDDGGTAITGYKIDSSENGGATWTV